MKQPKHFIKYLQLIQVIHQVQVMEYIQLSKTKDIDIYIYI